MIDATNALPNAMNDAMCNASVLQKLLHIFWIATMGCLFLSERVRTHYALNGILKP